MAGRAALCRAAQAEHEHKHKHEHKTVRTGVWEGATRPARALRPGVNFLASREAIGWAAASLRRTTYYVQQAPSRRRVVRLSNRGAMGRGLERA